MHENVDVRQTFVFEAQTYGWIDVRLVGSICSVTVQTDAVSTAAYFDRREG